MYTEYGASMPAARMFSIWRRGIHKSAEAVSISCYGASHDFAKSVLSLA
jgi:hypothetical protein